MMMSRITSLLFLLLMMTLGIHLWAQQKNGKPQTKGATGSKMLVPKTFLGNSDLKAGPITSAKFSSLMKQGLTAKDSLGNKYKVTSFEFGLATRNIYEDSVGNLQPVMDHSSTHCIGDTLSSDLTFSMPKTDSTDAAESIYERLKPGDTIYFDRVQVIHAPSAKVSADHTPFLARGMKFYIVK